MSRESFLAAVRDFHRSWELEAVDSVTVDTTYPKMTANGRYSQYSETIVDMSASTEYEDKYWDRVSELMGEHLGGSSLVVKHQQGSHDQQSHGNWARGRAGAIANSAVTGEPSGITLADLVEIKENPSAFGFEPTQYARNERRAGSEREIVEEMQRVVVEGHMIREKRQDEQFRRAAELTDGQKDDLVDYFETIRSEGTVFVASDQRGAAAIIEKGEFDTVFETNTSNGAVAHDARRREEFASHDLHPNLDPNLRPVYGYVAFNNPVAEGVAGYGDVRFELKPEVKERSTITDGDSLGSYATPIPMSGDPITQREAVGGSMGWQSMSGQMLDEVNAVGVYFPAILDESSPQLSFPRGETAIANIVDRTSYGSTRYIEAQVKGGVKIDDVARIHIDGGFARGDLREAAEERGIEIVYHG